MSARHGTPAAALIEDVTAFVIQGQYESALAVVREALASAGGNRERGTGYWLLADLQSRLACIPGEALQNAQAAEELLIDHHDARSLALLVLIHLAMLAGEWAEVERAVNLYSKMMAEAPEYRPMWGRVCHNYGEALLHQGRAEEALAHLHFAVEWYEANETPAARDNCCRMAHLLRAVCFVRTGDAPDAAEALRLADGPAVSTCWGDLRQAVRASYHVLADNPEAAEMCLAGMTPEPDAYPRMFAYIARAELSRLRGVDTTNLLTEALTVMAASRQLWAYGALVRLME